MDIDKLYVVNDVRTLKRVPLPDVQTLLDEIGIIKPGAAPKTKWWNATSHRLTDVRVCSVEHVPDDGAWVQLTYQEICPR